MRLEEKVEQLTELMPELVPTIDKLSQSHVKLERTVNSLEHIMVKQAKLQERTNLEMAEARLTNMKLAGTIEKFTKKIDRIDEFDKRLKRIEKIVLK